MKKAIEFNYVFFAVLIGLLLVIIIGCGKKGDPVSRRQIKLQMINNLSGEITKEGISLNWTLPEKTEQVKIFKIFRSAAITGEDCPGCPQKFSLLAEKDAGSLQSGIKGTGEHHYLDRDVNPGRSYGYHVVWCISSDSCSPESNTTEIKLK